MSWTISRRVAVGSLANAAFVLILVSTAVVAFQRTSSARDKEVFESTDRLVTTMQAVSDFRRANVDYLGVLLDPNQGEMRSRDSLITVTRAAFQKLGAQARSADMGALWQDAVRQLDAWDRTSREAIDLMVDGDDEGALAVRVVTAAQRDELKGLVESGAVRVRQDEDAAAAAAQARTRRNLLQFTLGGGVLILLTFGVAFLLIRSVTLPLRETSVVLGSSVAELLATSTQQAAGATETAAAVTQTVTTLEEVNRTSEQAAETARAVAEQAKAAVTMAENGRAAIDGSISAMTTVQEQVDSIAESILALADRAQAISEITSTVNDIAEQTKLLALNAAVEAARAGEHGRGFGVVATEIRLLATESAQATVQVRKILGEIQGATSTAVMTTEQGNKAVTAVGAKVREAGEVIRALADVVAAAARAGAQIAASAGQQAAGIAQIGGAMKDIHAASEQHLAASRQTQAAAHDLSETGDLLLELVGGNGAGRSRSARPGGFRAFTEAGSV